MSISVYLSKGIIVMTRIDSYRLTAALAGAAALTWFGGSPSFAADPTGIWQTEDGRARIRTEHCRSSKGDLCGYVVWLKDPRDDNGKSRLDASNTDTRKKDRPLLGHEMMAGLKPVAEGRYEGKVYNADNGKLYSSEVWSDEPSELSVKGCVAAILCGMQNWKRVSDVLPGQLQGPTDAAGGPRSER